MKEKQIYYLRDKEYGYVVGKFEAEEIEPHCVMGQCYEACGWYADKREVSDWHFVSDVYCKWDSCTHWYFYGEDYDPDINSEEIDSYYHICGESCFLRHIRLMCFVWKLVSDLMTEVRIGTEYEIDISDEYFSLEKTSKLVELMLEGYEIVKGE